MAKTIGFVLQRSHNSVASSISEITPDLQKTGVRLVETERKDRRDLYVDRQVFKVKYNQEPWRRRRDNLSPVSSTLNKLYLRGSNCIGRVPFTNRCNREEEKRPKSCANIDINSSTGIGVTVSRMHVLRV